VVIHGRGQYRETAPAVFTARIPGFLEMISRCSGDDDILRSTYGAGKPDHVPGSCTFNLGF
jgi:hypothetical protein